MKPSRDEAEQRGILNQYLSNPQEWNKYTYALNNPLKLVDPDGRNACGTNDDSNCKVTVTLQDRTKDKNGKYNDQFTGEKNQQQYNATATVSVNGKEVGTFLAKTTPSGDGYATVQNGTYSATLVDYHGRPSLLINGGGPVPVVGNFDAATKLDHATGILVHMGGLGNWAGMFPGRDAQGNPTMRAVSEGCQLVCSSQYGAFLHATGARPDAGTPQRHFTVTVNTKENQ